ncbi:LysM peptidoglycan-binding domain-containing protein [Senegalia massiliensis]|uniref:LysM peptidoglycan-binding domain-containing protein n=1 Tax=Senegalia massiliensis TaxID=1720316 RepID=UPI001030E20E|nr:LysM peptidoglycan-binding domain-containing protein [Senegalia massiliensis]
MQKRYRSFIKNIFSLAIIILFLVLFINTVKIDSTSYKEYKEVSYTVTYGDTLWSIAGEHIPPSEDKRIYIHEIKKINNLESSNLQIGQKLIILTEEE